MSIADDLGAFARLQRALAQPFADRGALIRAAQIDENELARAERRWEERFEGPEGDVLIADLGRIWRGDDAAEVSPSASSEEHAELDAPRPASAGAVVPSSPLVPTYLREAVSAPASGLGTTGTDETQLPVARPGPTLPFQEATPGVVPAQVQALRGAGRKDPTPPSPDGDETAFLALPLHDLDPATCGVDRTEHAAGVGQAADTGAPAMAIASYARFLVEFAAAPAQASDVRRRHGIASEDAQRALGASFAAWFAREPGRREEFDRLLAELRRGGTG